MQTWQEQFLTLSPKRAIDIVNSPNKSMSFMIAQHGELKVKALLTLLISETLDFFSIANSMSDNQIAQTVNLILEDFSTYKPDYFILCFNRAKKGNYGKSYNRIDGQIIFEWLRAFDLEFMLEIEEDRISEQKKLKSDVIHVGAYSELPPVNERPVPMPDYFKETISKIGVKKLDYKPKEPTPEQKYFNGLINEFNELHEEQGAEPGKKFVKYDGKMLDVNEYIEARVNQPKETK